MSLIIWTKFNNLISGVQILWNTLISWKGREGVQTITWIDWKLEHSSHKHTINIISYYN